MPLRTQKEIRQRAPLFLMGLLAFNFALMSMTARDGTTGQSVFSVWLQTAASPFQWAFTGVGGAGVGFFQTIANLRHAATENEELKGRLAETEAQLRAARAARDENVRLQGLLQLQQESQYESIAARVIARDPSAWFDTIVINRGSSSGVKLNMPVATREGVVGRVVGVSPWTAQVSLLTDERTAAGAIIGQLENSQALGVVRGTGDQRLLELRYIPGLVTVNPGDVVLTTGQDGIYPPGLKLGEVSEISKPGTATISHEIKVKPAARLNALKEIAVLLYQPPPRETPQQTLPNMKKTVTSDK